ncbi:hypothetical protein JOC83_002843 [Bacillus iocasae]|uniref:Uncharacterized protein n=1 Tax=Priestia iocasae TaxID=2291674 RepID=A0ABS2QWZ7_9BACI|nr:hypothetical protein [Metabacillus iocasae]
MNVRWLTPERKEQLFCAVLSLVIASIVVMMAQS